MGQLFVQSAHNHAHNKVATNDAFHPSKDENASH